MLFQFKHAAQQHVRNTNYQLWTHENHAIYMDPHIKDMYTTKLSYIHQNPVNAGLVENAEDYLLSSARDYIGRQGLIKVNFI